MVMAWRSAKSADPDQTPHNAVSDQDLHCFLLTFERKEKLSTNTREIEMGSSY